MRRVLKHKIEPMDEQVLNLPIGSKILSAKSQYGELVLYVSTCDEISLPTSAVNVIALSTSQKSEYLEKYVFIDTVELDGLWMFHVFCDRLEV